MRAAIFSLEFMWTMWYRELRCYSRPAHYNCRSVAVKGTTKDFSWGMLWICVGRDRSIHFVHTCRVWEVKISIHSLGVFYSLFKGMYTRKISQRAPEGLWWIFIPLKASWFENWMRLSAPWSAARGNSNKWKSRLLKTLNKNLWGVC